MASFRPLRADPATRDRVRRRASITLRFAALLSVSLHAALLLGALLWFRHSAPPADVPDQEGAVELVMVQNKGAGMTTAPDQPTPTPPPQALATPPPQPDANEPLPVPPVAPPAPLQPNPSPEQATAPPSPHVEEAPQINLGGTDSDTNAIAIGPHFIPASVDSQYHNKDPIYPEDAARRAEQGAVILLIHVSPEGLASQVDIEQSSGFARLDQSARDAVSTWHFLPAVKDGRPIPFDMPLRVVFHLN